MYNRNMCLWKICLLSFFLLYELIQCSSKFDIEACGKNNERCMIKVANNVLKYISNGIPSLNVKSLDPIIPNDFEGDSPQFTYKFTNNSISGFGKCEFQNIKFNLDLSTLLFNVTCPSLIIQGVYEVAGELVDLPLKRNGTYKVTTEICNKKIHTYDDARCITYAKILFTISGLYSMYFNTEFEKFLDDDGLQHLVIKKHVVSGQPKENIDFVFHRFTPNTSGSRQAQVRFEAEKFKELHVLTRDAYRAAVFGPLFTYVNRFLATIPYEEMFID